MEGAAEEVVEDTEAPEEVTTVSTEEAGEGLAGEEEGLRWTGTREEGISRKAGADDRDDQLWKKVLMFLQDSLNGNEN